MKVAAVGARLFLGLIFVMFGLSEWVEAIHLGEPYPFVGTMAEYGLLQLVKALQVIGGVMLLTNFYVPLALVILAPIATNIFFYAIFVDRSFLIPDIIIFALAAYLVWAYWDYFRHIVTRKAEPRA
ncbi:MAG: hypothetical protein GWN99_08695 [Gemmatimonadetes bacterium]|uniref:DoxX family protein n=1 Tax=Candidatus Kutchimonas denitrificans TaxID=3056748 RepID=A0AAE5CD44_9BACT|nr:hypothetical protein [Gemmatimonadota bacterium]NIR76575.1 hypothetical protein [Candidatus Kutchimonas denitrificans]NIS01131.1 hypothetical protein [Gemmatimonadota bacterium]NIT66898.1 hypothetical protein [Gemmatimonadota bacterium]NIU54671.1 hypothetical protein [Gemmatimonadota bacterium]